MIQKRQRKITLTFICHVYKTCSLKSTPVMLQEGTECVVCSKEFDSVSALVRHAFDKSRKGDKNGAHHKTMAMKGVVQTVCCKG